MKLFGKDPRADNLDRLVKEIAAGKTVLKARPAVVYLEAAAVCNLRCPMCPTTMGMPREPYRADFFDMELLNKVRPLLSRASRCFLSGGGEPLLHPRFFEMVEAVKSAGCEVYFNCNATLLDRGRARRLVEAGVDNISFSFDGATPETYGKIRVGADFERVLENIRAMAEIKKQAGVDRPFLNMQFTLLDLNLAEAAMMPDVAARVDINHLVVEPLTPVFNFDPVYRDFFRAHAVPPERVIDDLRRAARRAAELGIHFSSHYLFAADHPEPPRRCVQPWLTLGVRVDGRIFTCCGTMEKMGDLALHSWEEIWNGPDYRALRQKLAASEFPDFCAHCVAENRANHFNEDLVAG